MDASDKPIPPDEFAYRLIVARRWRGLTIKEAASACGLNYGSWSEWERGAQPQQFVATCEAIAFGLRVDRDWLVFGGPLARPNGAGLRSAA